MGPEVSITDTEYIYISNPTPDSWKLEADSKHYLVKGGDPLF